jgi:glucose/mannose transport system substrate-binding protein
MRDGSEWGPRSKPAKGSSLPRILETDMILSGAMRSSFNRMGAAGRALAMAAALLLAACSDGPAQTGSVEVLHWWKQGGEADAIGALFDLYRQRYRTVKIVDASVDGSKLARGAIQNRISQGSPPDTFQANGGSDLMYWVLYERMNDDQSKMQALDPSSLDWIYQVPDPVLQSVSYKGTVYGVPLNIHRLNTLFYNKAVFARVGIDVNDLVGPVDFDAVFVAAEKVRQYNQAHPELPAIAPISLGFRATEGDMATDDTWTLSLVFFENILLARLKPTKYKELFYAPNAGDAFNADMTQALADFRKLVTYSNLDASAQPWSATMDMVLHEQAAMTIMGDWGKGYANAEKFFGDTFGAIPTPGTAGTFAFTTDTFGIPIGARDPEAALDLLEVFGSQEGQDVFNPIKGSISARRDSKIYSGNYDEMAQRTFEDFLSAEVVGATSILAPPAYVDAVSAALAEFAKARENGNPSIVQHALDNYRDVLRKSCWPECRPPETSNPAPR